ncbi:MAG: hypothetical protein LBL99_01240 [Holosporaceae bacterium]|jgi:hypothetical protein|nr:hypothetical protein [Holosporaceae bacterium]
MTMIFDRNEIEFSLEKLSGCSFWDARKILSCQRKTLSEREKAFLVSKDDLSLFKKSDFYIQKVSLPSDFEKNKDDVYLIENIVAEFCSNVDRIRENEWWIYAARHWSNFRIIAGVGKGILLSRFLPLICNVSSEVSKTLKYLQRFGTMKNIKIFSPEISSKINSNINCKRVFIENNVDFEEFLLNHRRVKPIASDKNQFEKFLDGRVFKIIVFVVVLVLFGIEKCVWDKKRVVSSLEKSVRTATKDIKLEINEENFPSVKQVVEALKNSRDPLRLLEKASWLRQKYNIRIERLSFENGDTVKIKTSLNKSTLSKLKKESDLEIERNSNEEYEELGSDKKIGVVVCVK